MNHVVKKQQGFTIIEMMLAMTFVSFLLVAIAMSIIQIGAVYNQGTTLKEVNQASRDLDAELQRNIAAAGKLNLTTDFVFSPGSATTDAASAGGRLCLGTYSYIWNYARALNSSAAGVTKYASASAQPIRFIRVVDSTKSYCARSAASPTDLKVLVVSSGDQANSVEVLKSGDHDLGVHQFEFKSLTSVPTDTATSQQLFTISYRLGTSNTSAMNSDQSLCLAPNLPHSDALYCSVQQFGLVVRAGK